MNDIFGHALYSYWKGDRKTPYIIRRDDGFADEGSLEIYFTEQFFPTEMAVAKFIGGKILDVGCGAGRHISFFQKQNLEIYGIDISPLAIKVCRQRGCQNVFVLDAFQTTFAPGLFDTILLFGNNIGIGGTPVGAAYLLKGLRELVKPGGKLLLDSRDVTKTKRARHLEYHKKNLRSGRYPGEIRIRIEYKGRTGDWFRWLHLKSDELIRLAEQTGWTVKEIFETNWGEYAAVLMPGGFKKAETVFSTGRIENG